MTRNPDTIEDACRMIRDGSISITELTTAAIAAARASQSTLNAFITITEQQALARAARLEAELRSGHDRGLLHGIPIAHKDNLDTKNILTTRGCAYFARHVPVENAAVVSLLEEAGCITIGKANMKELAAGGSGDNRWYGPVRNPWNLDRSAGGSSSGTAAANAAGICLAGTGSDSGGSIRGPASWNGVVGIRPTSGLVSREGCFPRSHTLDCVGPIARTVRDAAILLSAMAGRSLAAAARDGSGALSSAGQCNVRELRIGIIEDYSFESIEPAVEASVRNAIDAFAGMGASIRSIRLPTVGSEAYHEQLLRLLQYEFARIIKNDYFEDPDRFGRFVQNDVERGLRVSDKEYSEIVETAQATSTEFASAFAQVDVIVTPSQPFVAQPFSRPDEVFARCRQFMLPFSFAGLPSMSVPCGLDADRMPIGMQLVCPRMADQQMIDIATAYVEQHPFCERPGATSATGDERSRPGRGDAVATEVQRSPPESADGAW
jgi:aspartyl-tRNA(Asn)/glutamyl-tRNA(Gln) amidotransferase subunit A